MARPKTIDTTDILNAARELFLERGIDVPTAEIARHAGVSEGSIFKRFPTKQALFIRAMNLPEKTKWLDDLQQRVGTHTVVENLSKVLHKAIAFFRANLPRMMMLWSARDIPSPVDLHKQLGSSWGPFHAIDALTRYIEGEIKVGRIANISPEVVARLLLASAVHFTFLEAMGVQVRGPLSGERYIDSVVETIWRGIAGDDTQTGKEEPPRI